MTTLYLFCLFLKHTLADLVLQARLPKAGKGDLKNSKGYIHALDHAVLTLLVTLAFTFNLTTAFYIAIIDYILHFVIDHNKTLISRRMNLKFDTQKFWTVQGVDQALHFSCYLLYVYLVFGF